MRLKIAQQILCATLILSQGLLTCPVAFAANATSESEKIAKEICLSTNELKAGPVVTAENGKPLKTFYVEVAESAGKPSQILDCTSVFKDAENTKNCPQGKDEGFKKLIGFTREIQYRKDLDACAKTGTPKLSSACVKEIGCNASRTAMNLASLGMFNAFGRASAWMSGAREDHSCLGANQDDCLTKAIGGIIKDLISQVTGIAEIPGMIWRGGKWVASGIYSSAQKGYHWLTNSSVQSVEDQLSTKMMAARTVSSARLAQFRKDPIAFMGELATKLINEIMQAVTPLAQKSKLAIACSSCNGIINGACEIMGYLGGEVLTAFFTGGAANLASKISKVSKVSSALEKMDAAAKALVKGAAEYKVLNAGMKVVKLGGKGVVLVGETAIKGLSHVPGAKQYLSLTEDAFMKGYLSRSAFTEWKSVKGAVQAVSQVEKLRGVGQSKGLVSEYEKALIGEHSEVNWTKLSQAEADAKLRSFSGDRTSAVLEPKTMKLVSEKNSEYVFKSLNPEQQAEVAKLQKEVNFQKLSPEKQAEFINKVGDTHFKGKVIVSDEGLSKAQYEAISKKPEKEILELAKDGKIKLKPNRVKAAALVDFRQYLEKEHRVKDSFAAVDGLANQRTMVLGELATGDARTAEKIAAQSKLVSPDTQGKTLSQHYSDEASKVMKLPERSAKLNEFKHEVENQLEYWNAESLRIRRASEEALNPAPFSYEGKTYAPGEEKKSLLKEFDAKSEAIRKTKKELELAYQNFSGVKYKPEPVAPRAIAETATGAIAPTAPAAPAVPVAPAAGKAELTAYTEKLNETRNKLETAQTQIAANQYSMTQVKKELEALKNQKLEALQFERQPGKGQSNEEIVYLQREAAYRETQRKVDQAITQLEGNVKVARQTVAECADYTAYPVGRGGMIDQKIDYMLAEQKNPVPALTDLRTKLEKDLKKLSFIREEDHATLFPGVDFQTMRTRIQQNIEEINRRMPK